MAGGPSPQSIIIIVWTLTALSGIFMALRFYCKRFRNAKYAMDDWVLLIAFIATVINCGMVTVNVNLPPLPPGPPPAEALNKITIYSSVSVTFAIVAQSFSKVSFGLTLIPLCQGWLRRFVWGAIILINVFFGLGGLFQWAGCRPIQKGWKPLTPGTCLPDDFPANFGIFVSAFSGTMDLCFALIPWKIILGLQMNKREKLGVAFAMSLGIFAAAAAYIKCYYLNTLRIGRTPSPMLSIFGVVEPTLTIIAASVPFLRVLVKHVASTQEYYLSDYGAGNTARSASGNNPKFSRGRTMVSSSRAGRASDREEGDTGSDKSILDHPASIGVDAGRVGDNTSNGIVRTKVFEVSYEARKGSRDQGTIEPRHDRD